jgi:glyoxylase-like metal-dependent hydrolase (beta-lactamase superfamily II)
MFSKRHNVPLEAALGGPQTMYPEYMLRVRQLAAGSTAPAATSTAAAARPDGPVNPAAEGITSQPVGGQVWMVTAGGRNVAVQIGSEGVLVVDPGEAALADGVLAEIRKLANNKPIRYIVNTSGDAALFGGNLTIGAGATETAQRAAIIAHENTSLRIARAGVRGSAIPSDVFFRGTRELYFNDEPIEIIHTPSAYSDGDVIVFFRKSDVIVAGHVIEDLTFPVIGEGGSLNGTIDALNRILLLAVASWRSQGGTQVIPARGRPYDEGDVAEYRDMVTILRDRVQDAVGKGRTLAQIKADRLSQDYDARYGGVPGPGSTETFLDSAYQSLAAARKGTN